MKQKIHYTTSSDGTSIAYAVAGEGPPLVKVANYISHLEYDWDSPVWRHLLNALSKYHTLIRYDERGTGLSDWKADDLSFEAWVSDLEAVVDTLGLEHFPIYAQSQGGPVAVAYAAKHPEKVSHLILLGTYARGWLHRDLSDEKKEEERTLITLMKIGWGRKNPAFRQFFISQLMPEATHEQIESFNEIMRHSAEAEIAAELERNMHLVDVSDYAGHVQAPTIIFHARQDQGVPFGEGRHLASLIPEAQFVSLESKNHIITETEPAWLTFVSEMYRFLGIEENISSEIQDYQVGPARTLTTIFFTDIVSSTEMAAKIGDREWRKLLEQHHVAVREALAQYHGNEVKIIGDGFLATFHTPTLAIRCAMAIFQAVSELGINVRCGLHTSEIEYLEDDLGGIGVHIAARVVDLAEANEVLATSTVKELVEGSGIEFEEKGTFDLRGIPGKRKIFSVKF